MKEGLQNLNPKEYIYKENTAKEDTEKKVTRKKRVEEACPGRGPE